jgi:hypothetical protein
VGSAAGNLKKQQRKNLPQGRHARWRVQAGRCNTKGGKRWDRGALLRTAVGAMLAGAQSQAEVEELSTRKSTPNKRLFGIQRPVPDTTLRDALCTVEPQTLRGSLRAVVHQAHRKALDPSELPFGVISLDGKAFSIPATEDWYAQRQTQSDQGPRFADRSRPKPGLTPEIYAHRLASTQTRRPPCAGPAGSRSPLALGPRHPSRGPAPKLGPRRRRAGSTDQG